MGSSNKKPTVQNHSLSGVKIVDGDFYVPVFQIIKLCKRFGLHQAKDLAIVIERALNDIKTNEDKKKAIPIMLINDSKFQFNSNATIC